jgi:hypothetical protein
MIDNAEVRKIGNNLYIKMDRNKRRWQSKGIF